MNKIYSKLPQGPLKVFVWPSGVWIWQSMVLTLSTFHSEEGDYVAIIHFVQLYMYVTWPIPPGEQMILWQDIHLHNYVLEEIN